jgi:hypothetical protein
MPSTIDLTTLIGIPNVAKLVISEFVPNDDAAIATMRITVRTGVATDCKVCELWPFTISNTTSDQWERQTSPPVGKNVEDIDRYIVRTTRSTPTGYTDLINAWRAGSSVASRGTALKTHLLSAGHIGATLTGT